MQPTPVDAADVGAAGVALQVRYVHAHPAALLADARTLALVGFGDGAPEPVVAADPRYVRVPLPVLGGPAPCEVWTVDAPVHSGRTDGIRHATAGGLQLVALDVAEHDGDIRAAAREAYARLRAFLARSSHGHALRVWNTIPGITAGEGDGERYRQFCIGRAEGMGSDWGPFPAATAVGSDAAGLLQVHALAATAPGVPLENPRQVSAWRYPRQYGPQPPSFARAMLAGQPALPLLLSGTASVVGHASAHAGSVEAQLAETCANLEQLLAAARERRPSLPAQFGPGSTLKVYVADPGDAALVRARLEHRFPGAALLLLRADVCRRELLVEVDGFHGP